MSKISTVYDAILAELAAVFPSKTQIPDPYSLTDNKIGPLKDGYGLKWNDDSFIPVEFNSHGSSYTFSVVFTRELIRLDSQYAPIHVMAKAFLEDVKLFKDELYRCDKLGVASSIDNIVIGTTSGPVNIFGDNNRYKFVELFFSINLREAVAAC